MKALLNTPTEQFIAFFKESTTNSQILDWVNTNTITGNKIFELNEYFSCSATLDREFGKYLIHIRGDEDYKEFEIVDLKKIAITL